MEARQPELVTCACIMCNGHVQFEKQHAGLRINCPHCGMDVLLYIPSGCTTALPIQPPPQPGLKSPPNPGSSAGVS